jgi:hypothetical protein
VKNHEFIFGASKFDGFPDVDMNAYMFFLRSHSGKKFEHAKESWLYLVE